MNIPALILPDPAALEAVPAAELPALALGLAALQSAIAARLIVCPAAPTSAAADDLIDDVAEVARITRHSESWVRKSGHRLPGFRQPGGKGTRVAWSRRALEAWVGGPVD